MSALNRIFSILFLMLLCGSASARYKVYTTPVIPLTKPLSNHFSGELNGQLWTWGGYGYTKHRITHETIREVHAYMSGASVEVPQGTIGIGGVYEEMKSLSEVFLTRRVTYRESSMSQWQYDRGSRKTLTPLPKAIHYNVAAYWDGYLYTLGGMSDSVPNMDVYRLEWPNGTAWETLGTIPGDARVQSVCSVQMSAAGPCIYVFGGYCPPTEGKPGYVHRDGLCFNLNTQTWSTLGWDTTDADALPSVAACAQSLGCATIAVIGGANAERFTAYINNPEQFEKDNATKPTEWFGYQQDVLLYNTFTNSWNRIPGNEHLARTNAGLARVDGFWFMSGGEVKPGECTDQVTCVEIVGGKRFGVWDWMSVLLVAAVLLGGIYVCKKRGKEDETFPGTSWRKNGVMLYMRSFGCISFWILPFCAFTSGWSIFLVYVVVATIMLVNAMHLISKKEKGNERTNETVQAINKVAFILWQTLRLLVWLLLPSYIIAQALGMNWAVAALAVGLVPLAAVILGRKSASPSADMLLFGFLAVVVIALVFYLSYTAGFTLNAQLDWNRYSVLPAFLAYMIPVFAMSDFAFVLYLIPIFAMDDTQFFRMKENVTPQLAKKSVRFAYVLTLGMGLLMMLTGILIHSYYKNGVAVFPVNMDEIVNLPFTFLCEAFPAGVSGFFIAVFFGAAWCALIRQLRIQQAIFRNLIQWIKGR